MGFFSEMEVWSDGVLEEMNDEVAEQNEVSGIVSAELQAGQG